MADEPELLVDAAGGVVCVTLNRPRALNAVSLPMFRELNAGLAQWASDPAVRMVLFQGAGERAFCSGGDIRAVYEAGTRGDFGFTADLFRCEYTADWQVHSLGKPSLALMDGVVMGGGCGLSVLGTHRVVTERTLLAMPETGIGFFPDVGAAWFLSQCPGRIGLYMALASARLGAADVIYAGLADAYVPSDRLEDLTGALSDGLSADDAITRFAEDAGPAPLAEHRAAIDRCFAGGSVAAIIAALEAEEGNWACRTLEALAARPPFSLTLTFRAVAAAPGRSLKDCLVTDYRVCQRFMHRPDFYEGIRAMLVDKDNSPTWHPGTLTAVDEREVESYFASLGEDDLELT
jgi:enoyl-CoA hydratase